MEKSEAVGGANPTMLEAVNLTGPRQSSSGHKTKVSMMSMSQRVHGLRPTGLVVVAKVAVATRASISSNFATTASHTCVVCFYR